MSNNEVKIEIDTCRNDSTKLDTEFIKVVIEKTILEALNIQKSEEE